ncbi:AraC family transcriptional regulator [Pontibacter ummariensis]|uniref:AraC family transcriptional regulator n=1 Tax=Pontibacter ummariensis TaxID=1610492 RepID=A0A239LXQ5_9BACT|nr:AraC family transcriptional regulator [Pontibacter ummariensis]PRY00366.1 AraC family transcriptional regulator [Pontibacter ummariensis]SNT34424.1 AraC family transcriptional regulator [Pontibacter ummariensis]
MHASTQQHIFQSRLYIERNLGEVLNGEIIAERAFLSYFHFQHQFKASTGESVWQYVKRLRMEKAAFLLLFTSSPVSDVAFGAGFETAAAFSKAFRAWHGQSPQQYRQQHLQHHSASQGLSYNWNAVKQVRLPAQKVVSFRAEGIQQFPQGYFKWQQLAGSLAEQNVALIGRSPDQPGITPYSKLRWDTAVPEACLPQGLKQELTQEQLLFEDSLPGGHYLVVPFTGFGRPLPAHLPAILAYLRKQGLEWRPSGYSFQVLRQHETDSRCSTDLFIPVL